MLPGLVGRADKDLLPRLCWGERGHVLWLQNLGYGGIPQKRFTETWRNGAARSEGWAFPSCACGPGSGCPHAGFSGNPVHCCSAGPAVRAGVRGGGAPQASS